MSSCLHYISSTVINVKNKQIFRTQWKFNLIFCVTGNSVLVIWNILIFIQIISAPYSSQGNIPSSQDKLQNIAGKKKAWTTLINVLKWQVVSQLTFRSAETNIQTTPKDTVCLFDYAVCLHLSPECIRKNEAK